MYKDVIKFIETYQGYIDMIYFISSKKIIVEFSMEYEDYSPQSYYFYFFEKKFSKNLKYCHCRYVSFQIKKLWLT